MKNSARVLVSALVLLFPLFPLFSSMFLYSAFAVSSGDVVINEVLYDPLGTDTGLEWVELYNKGSDPVDLTGYDLDPSSAKYFTFPVFTLEPNAFVVIHINTIGDDATTDLYDGGSSNMGNTKGPIALFSSTTHSASTLVDYIEYGAGGQTNESKAVSAGLWTVDDFVADVEAGSSIGLKVDGEDTNASSDWQEFTAPTQGSANMGTPDEAPPGDDSGDGEEEEEEEDQVLGITFSLPSEATAGEGFEAAVTVENAAASSDYYAKALVGESTESYYEGYTYNPVLDKWLAWNGSWEEMPTFTTDAAGGASFNLTSKVKDDTESGTYYYLARIRKVDTDDNLDSEAQTLLVSEALDSSNSSTSSNDPEVTFSVTDTDLKVNKSFDVKVEIKNAEPLRDYYVKVRLGLEESKLTKGRTYFSFYDTWLWDGKSWADFPILYTDSEGVFEGTIKAKVNSGNPAGTYYVEVRIRDKEVEKNYDSESQTLDFGEEDLEVIVEPSPAEGAVLGSLTELPATGGGLLGRGGTSLLVMAMGIFGRILFDRRSLCE